MLLLDQAHEILRNEAPNGYALGCNAQDPQHFEFHSTFDPDWQMHYFKENLIKIDPIVGMTSWFAGVTNWSSIYERFSDSDGRTVFNRAADYGLSSGEVYCLSVNGSKAVASLGVNRPTSEVTRKELMSALATVQLHSTQNIVSDALPLGSIELLQKLVEGKRGKEICDDLGISQSALNQRKERLLNQTGSKTIIEAVVKASAKGVSLGR